MGSTGLVVVGVDVGQRHDPTAIAVVERDVRELEPARLEPPKRAGWVEPGDYRRIPAKTETHHVTRHLGRVPLGTPYPKVAEHVAAIVAGLVARGVPRPRIMVDATGVGIPVVELIAAALGQHGQDLIAATFTHGDRYTQDDTRRTASVGKAHLVSALQALLQTRRLHLPKTEESAALGRELQDYEIRVDADANDTYGAFKVGTHDDLVTALGLATVYRLPPSRRLIPHAGIPRGGY